MKHIHFLTLRFVTLSLCAANAAACGQTFETSKYRIVYYCDPQVNACLLNPNQIDVAWETALKITNSNNLTPPVSDFTNGAFGIGEQLYSGIEFGGETRTWYEKCLFNSDSALIHEYVHWIFEQRNILAGDPNHTADVWKTLANQNSTLMTIFCPPVNP